jgi:multisubunit Na+/H+ antiporter MnhG subunit
MKKWIAIIGVFITLFGLFQVVKYLFDYNSLTDYGKGYVWGSIFLLIVGFFLIIYGVRKKKTSP